jgi:hypothetical protein
MIKRNDFKSIMIKHFKGVLTPEIIDATNQLTSFAAIRNEDYLLTEKEILLNIYACFLYKELDFTFTMGVINNNLQRIKTALNELTFTQSQDFENPFRNIIEKSFHKNITGVFFTHRKIGYHYWTYSPQGRQINTISYKLKDPFKSIDLLTLGKFKIFVSGETMLNCLREIDAKSIDIFDAPCTKIISVPIKSNDN